MNYFIHPIRREKVINVFKMKKILICVMFLMIILLQGCKSEEEITMIVPYGSPQFSQLYMQDSSDYLVDIVMGPDPLVAAFGSLSHDVIFAPINLGAKLYTSKPDYTLLAVITWGNYYIISTNPLEQVSDLKEKDLVIFGKNQISDMLIQKMDQYYQLDLNLTYVDSLATATAHALLNPSDYVLIAEPSLSKLLDQNDALNYLDLQNLYHEMTGESNMPQAGVFVKSTLSQSIKDKVSRDISSSIAKLESDASGSAELAIKLGMDFEKDILIESFTLSHIMYVSAMDAKADVELLFDDLLGFLPAMIGGQKPDEAFYED